MAITDVWNSPRCERLTTLLQPLLRETQARLLLSSTGAKAALSEGSGQSGWRQSGRLYWLNFGRSHSNHCPDLNHPRNTRFEFEMTLVLTRMMVTNLHLKPLTCASLRASHHTRVVDQNVNLCISIFRYQSLDFNLCISGSGWQFQDISGYQCKIFEATLEKLLEICLQHSFTLLRLLRSSLITFHNWKQPPPPVVI